MKTNNQNLSYRRGIWLSLIVGVGVGIGAGLASRSSTASAAPARIPIAGDHAHHDHAHHGEDDPLAVDLVPLATFIDGDGNQRIEYEYVVDPSSEAPTEIAIAYEIVTAGGDVVEATEAGTATVDEAGEAATGSVVLPSELPDGYLVVRATAAGSDGDSAAVQTAEQYVQVVNGQAAPISYETWHAESGIDEAVVTETDVQPQTPEEARALFDTEDSF
jgi:hypothetical protein